MTTTADHARSDAPWYKLKSSIMMISVTIIALFSIGFDYLGNDAASSSGLRLSENGTIASSKPSDSIQR